MLDKVLICHYHNRPLPSVTEVEPQRNRIDSYRPEQPRRTNTDSYRPEMKLGGWDNEGSWENRNNRDSPQDRHLRDSPQDRHLRDSPHDRPDDRFLSHQPFERTDEPAPKRDSRAKNKETIRAVDPKDIVDVDEWAANSTWSEDSA